MKEKARLPLESLACVNKECQRYGQSGLSNLKVRKTYGRDEIRYLRCSECGEEFSERKGSALWNCKIGEERAVRIAEQLAEGMSLKGTVRTTKSSRDAVRRMNRRLGSHGGLFHDALVEELECTAIQGDERWGFAGNKTNQQWEAEVFDPKSRLVIERQQGPRDEQLIEKVLEGACNRLANPKEVVLFSDGDSKYATLFPKVFGRPYTPSRKGSRGRRPNLCYRIARTQAHVQVIKHRQGKRVIEMDIHYTHGSKKRVHQELERLGYTTPNTSAIERRNATARSMDSCAVRKTLAFARKPESRQAKGAWAMNVYNWARPNRSLRIPIPLPQGKKRFQQRSPAMAAGLTDHIWTIQEIIAFPVYPSPGLG